MSITKGPIEGVVVMARANFVDERSQLTEIFRYDQLPVWFRPEMSYLSVTISSVMCGQHEQVDQADLVAWYGPGEFKLTLWGYRPESPICLHRTEVAMGVNNPGLGLIPKRVVDCYRCISPEPGPVINHPSLLYMGEGKAERIDEIRHGDNPENVFVKDKRTRRVQP